MIKIEKFLERRQVFIMLSFMMHIETPSGSLLMLTRQGLSQNTRKVLLKIYLDLMKLIKK